MKFEDFLKPEIKNEPFTESVQFDKYKVISEQANPEEILRANGYKIKLSTPTLFGTQIDFAKKYEESDIKELLKDFNIKFKGNSVFIIK